MPLLPHQEEFINLLLNGNPEDDSVPCINSEINKILEVRDELLNLIKFDEKWDEAIGDAAAGIDLNAIYTAIINKIIAKGFIGAENLVTLLRAR